ncbi:MAG: hypothetical protein RL291_746, partial [Pseudomonadota bacterium]
NGHARRDGGVPHIVRALAPERQVLTIGFLEFPRGYASPNLSRVYDIVVRARATSRPDPCIEMQKAFESKRK